MNVHGKIFLILCLQALEVLSDHAQWTPISHWSYDYSWLATMEYQREARTSEYCGGAVINYQFVLTAAQCVTGKWVDDMRGLTGVRLGDYSKMSSCANGTAYSNSYQRFGIAGTILHGDSNSIALVRLDRKIRSETNIKPVLLRPNPQHPIIDTQLVVPGWVLPLTKLKSQEALNNQEKMMWAGVQVDIIKTARGRKTGRRMLLKDIVTFRETSSCGNPYICYIQLANYRRWIHQESKIKLGSDVLKAQQFPTTTTTQPPKQTNVGKAEFQFPTDCGDSPIYPRELMDSGYKIEPDEFSWLASLVYAKYINVFGYCSGSVISARYVLTTRNCVQQHPQLGRPIGVRLGRFDNKFMCDYGTYSCKQYQYFAIADIKVATNPWGTKNNLALLKLNQDIKFGPKMKPICLPFDETHIPPPFEDSFLTVAGWWTTTYPNDLIAKRSASIAFWNTTSCLEAALDKDKQVCGVKPGTSPCTVELGSPLMNMFERRRMVLEGIAYRGVGGCPGPNVGTLFTRVRSFENWIIASINELETRTTNGQISNTAKSQIQTQNNGRNLNWDRGANNYKNKQTTDNRYNNLYNKF